MTTTSSWGRKAGIQIFVSDSIFAERIGKRIMNSRIFSTSNNESISSSSSSSSSIQEKRIKRKRNKKAGKDKRSEFIGMAKAVDRGQWSVVYSPGGKDGTSFVAKSGLPDKTRPFTVLGIESSCDDTGAAVVRSDGVILGESLASQHKIHEEWGGVVPGLAKLAHEEKIDVVIEEAIQNAGLSSIDEIDAIGVTVGPGLEICLRVGCNKARELAIQFQKPFVAIHHLEAHILMARLPPQKKEQQSTSIDIVSHESNCAIQFPFLALLVSGGHCQMLKCLGVGRYSIIGGTIDDSLGEAYDKTARLLGLPIGGGGGPAIEALAKEGDPKAVKLPIPLQKRKDFDFSYAGLKTAVRTTAEKLCIERNVTSIVELSHQDRANIAASFQNVAITHIEQRLKRAMDLLENDDQIKTLAVVGGVAANQELRSRLETLCTDQSWQMFVPPPRLCTDQGSMSAWAAIERLMVCSSDSPENQKVHARFPFQQQQ